jgi:hypothetical protein
LIFYIYFDFDGLYIIVAHPEYAIVRVRSLSLVVPLLLPALIHPQHAAYHVERTWLFGGHFYECANEILTRVEQREFVALI